MLHPVRLRHLRTLLVLATAIMVAPVLAQDKRSDWPEGSSMHTGFLMAERRDAAEAQLEQQQARLMALVIGSRTRFPDQRLVSALQSQHAAWLVYRTAECELFGALTGAGGTWPTTHALGCDGQQTEQRVEEVAMAIACIEALPAEEREFSQNACLYPLAPISGEDREMY
ncbi:lysozyme inhibitor LprI family protein [Lysobacter sp. A286]